MQVLGLRTRYMYRSALHLSQPVSKPSTQLVLKRAITVHQSQNGPARFEMGQPLSKLDGRLQTGLSCELGLNIYTYTHTCTTLLLSVFLWWCALTHFGIGWFLWLLSSFGVCASHCCQLLVTAWSPAGGWPASHNDLPSGTAAFTRCFILDLWLMPWMKLQEVQLPRWGEGGRERESERER